ncbi:TIGR04211 family SH3 domain-containing protein [Pseudomonas sp. NW5]|uniref:TIGR04211 family SH3 domain-containing protein n=1 Tax=Pseudomonas sp. NW5 TaxID=2934934 RepID=UPI0020204592|nr:TIGR04211 family SH3 domain-containing protein [Pseudomonas sp. NW5]MCL7463181.1 TIGR04211 family SH3 domain-containing protein [Pseudomonas sp. NW5]
MPRSLSRTLPSLLLAALLTPALATASEENARWVSDNLNVYVRSGPSDGHRITGTLSSGQKVELLATQGAYSQVRNSSGKVAWLPSSDLQGVPGQAERLPQLEQRVLELETELKGIDDAWKLRVQGMQETLDARKTLIDELQVTRSTLEEQLTASHSEVRALKAQLGNEQQQVLMTYMVYGGSIAGAGLLAGLFLPTLARVRRRRNDQWV